jgi:hypothetical protein
MQRNVGGIAILTDDHYDDPLLWEILWRALLAGDDHQDHESAGLGQGPQTPGMSAVTLTVRINSARDH